MDEIKGINHIGTKITKKPITLPDNAEMFFIQT